MSATVTSIGRFRSSTIIDVARILAAAFLLPLISSLLWWLDTRSALHFRGWVNVEYLLLLALAMLIPSRWMVALLTGELTIAIVEPIARLYYFSPADAIFSMRYLLLVPAGRLAGYVALTVLYMVCCAMMLRSTLRDRPKIFARQVAAVLILCVAVLSACDMLSGRRMLLVQHKQTMTDVDVCRHYLVRVPVISLLRGMCFGLAQPANSPSESLSSALKVALSESNRTGHPDVVLVITESWGLAKDAHVNEMQMAPYWKDEVESRYQVESGTVPFLGATTSGETRELCGESVGRFTPTLPHAHFSDCWPDRLKKEGYQTLAVHGFTPNMFSRKDWYGEMGFQQSAFLPELVRDGAGSCDGAFPGACDADVGKWIGDRLVANRDPSPMFIHWVTLNSHLPLPLNDVKAPSSECTALNMDQQSSLCSWFTRVLVVHKSVAKLAMRPQLRPTIFVIVGDHAPPFLQAVNRSRFSQTRVPYVLLIPRTVSGWNVASSQTAYRQVSPEQAVSR